MLGNLSEEVEIKHVEFVAIYLHSSQKRIYENGYGNTLVIVEYLIETSHHELSNYIIVYTFDHSKGKNLVDYWSLIVSY